MFSNLSATSKKRATEKKLNYQASKYTDQYRIIQVKFTNPSFYIHKENSHHQGIYHNSTMD